MTFRIITYNIHKGIGGLDRRYRPERIVETLTRYDPDIILMQEVDDLVPRSKHHCQVELFAEALQMNHYVFQRNVTLKQGHYGNAILSRFPLTGVHHLDVTIPFKKRRQALLAHCNLQKKDGSRRSMLIVNLHLGLSGLERKSQLRKVLKNDVIQHAWRKTPLVIGGDYNDVWGTLGKRIMQPAGFACAGKRIRTFPAALPMRALDHIFYRGDVRSHHVFAPRSQLARQASDHLPLVADFELLR